MTTLGALIEATRHSLAGFDQAAEAVAAVAYELTPTAKVVRVDDVSDASIGIAEVDFELLRVKGVDRTSSDLILFPFGRGYRGTTATTHAVDAEVRFNPAWPASTVAREINGVLAEIYPDVYAVKAHETTLPVRGGVDVPADAAGVISVWVNNDADGWLREDRWDWQPDSAADGRALRVGGHYSSGVAVRVVYAARPVAFDLSGALTQDFATVTGLDARCSDLIQLGVAARLAPFIDVAKMPFQSAQLRAGGEGSTVGSTATTARLLYSLFKQRVAQESAVLAKEHPIRVHRTGVI